MGRVIADLDAERGDMSDIIDQKNREILQTKDENDSAKLKISRLDQKLVETRDENDKLVRRINQLEALVLDYNIDIESFQEQVDQHAFKSDNTCLNPLVFWSGYILAVIIVFAVCICHVIKHSMDKRKKKPAS